MSVYILYHPDKNGNIGHVLDVNASKDWLINEMEILIGQYESLRIAEVQDINDVVYLAEDHD